jgi:F-type H+-transporting ATPase subunit delta
MIEGRLSRRYTKALFLLAQEEQKEEEVGQQIERFLAVYTTSPLITVLNNPAFGAESRKKILLDVAKRLDLFPLVLRFLSLLLERDRLTFLPSIASVYRRFLNEAKGRVEAKVVSVAPLEASLLARLSEVLEGLCGKKVLLQEESDPALVGGMLIELEGKVYDGSVRTQLEKMKERITRGY